mgnify:CR=1 FL=1
MTGYPRYSQTEERLNVSLHALGFLLSVAALVALLLRASALDSMLVLVSFGLFGVSLVLLYGISTLYHSAQNPRLRSRLRVADHASIYVLIAGTYSPFALIVMQGSIGWTIFAVSWSMALAGIVLKLFYIALRLHGLDYPVRDPTLTGQLWRSRSQLADRWWCFLHPGRGTLQYPAPAA